MHQICKVKNADYTGPEGDDPFANFSRVEHLGIATTEQGFLTRMTDKMSRLSSFSRAGVLHVKDESVEDTLFDLANYCLLMAGYLRSKRVAEKEAAEAKAVTADFTRKRALSDVYGQQRAFNACPNCGATRRIGEPCDYCEKSQTALTKGQDLG
jgi:hypothetical protein